MSTVEWVLVGAGLLLGVGGLVGLVRTPGPRWSPWSLSETSPEVQLLFGTVCTGLGVASFVIGTHAAGGWDVPLRGIGLGACIGGPPNAVRGAVRVHHRRRAARSADRER